MNIKKILPYIDIRSGKAKFIRKPIFFEPGYNRSDEACTLDAENDWDTIIEFINEYKESPKTFRSYASELERFITWLMIEKQIPISAFKRSHVTDYMNFLKKPQPEYLWCAHKANKYLKDSSINKKWHPFCLTKEFLDLINNNNILSLSMKDQIKIAKEKNIKICGLSESTTRRARKILDSFFKHLVENNYLYGNPLISKRTKGQRKKKTRNSIERYFEINQLLFILETLKLYEDSLHEDDTKSHFIVHRARYLFLLYLHTGMRISEPAGYTMGDLENHNGEWKIFIQGKGDEKDEGRDIQLGNEFIDALKNFRLSVGLSPLPLFEEKIPLVPQENLKLHINERQISNIFRWLFDFVAKQQKFMADTFDNTSDEYSQLKREVSIYNSATCHWLRHSHATYFLQLTDDLKATQERLGHADVGTTMIYLHTINEKKKNQANNFSLSKILKND